ncbi:integrase core domain-containing protein [Corynebacterium sp. 13CS0277]|uniref:integrase core domain-containing protein n=1 Tax=Corynebacterium sp. 13CS0277 TaxID=2071994 RepID=UPI000D033A3C
MHRELVDTHRRSRRIGVWWDHPMQESHWSRAKTERTSLRVYATRAEAEADVREWIQWFHVARRHSAIGGVSPVAREASVWARSVKSELAEAA